MTIESGSLLRWDYTMGERADIEMIISFDHGVGAHVALTSNCKLSEYVAPEPHVVWLPSLGYRRKL